MIKFCFAKKFFSFNKSFSIILERNSRWFIKTERLLMKTFVIFCSISVITDLSIVKYFFLPLFRKNTFPLGLKYSGTLW